MKTKDAHPLGIAWVTLIFLAVPAALFYVDYGSFGRLGVALVGLAAALVVFSIMAVLFWVSQLRTVRLPAAWHRIRSFDRRHLYRRLGVRRFRAWLLGSPFRHLNQSVHLTGSSPEELARLEAHMTEAEASHIIAFGLTAVLTPLFATYNAIAFLPWLVLWNVLGNLYPILLQRMNRARIAGLRGRLDRSARS